MRRSLASVIAVVALALSACSDGSSTSSSSSGGESTASKSATFPVTVKHTAGETTIKSQPKKVAVLELGALDTLDAVGFDGVAGLPRSGKLPSFLEKYGAEKYTDLGNAKEPNMDALATLGPDLVVTGGRTAELYPQVSKNFTAIDSTVQYNDYTASVKANVTSVSTSVGKAAEGKKANEAIDAKVAEVKKAAQSKGVSGKTGIFLLVTGGKVKVFGAGSRFGIVNDLTGITDPVTKDPKADQSHGADISFETIAQLNPDYIWVLDRDAVVGGRNGGKVTPASEVLDNSFVKGTKASQNGKIAYVTPERWYLIMQGAKNYPAMLDELIASL